MNHSLTRISLGLSLLLALSSGCAEPMDSADASNFASSSTESAEETPALLDENGVPFDYVYDPNSPFLPATGRLFLRALKADEYDDIRWWAPQHYALTAPPANIDDIRPMVEWEPMEAVVLQWPSGYLGNTGVSKTALDIAKHASVVSNVWIITDPGGTNPTKQALLANGVSQSTLNAKFYFMETAIDSIWFIDSGPLPIIDTTTNTFAFADFRYYHQRAYDDGVPTALGRNLTNMGMSANTATYRMPVNTEGGTFQATSDGVCFTGTRQLYYMSCDQTGCDKSTGGTPAWSGSQYVNINNVQNHPMAKQLKKEWADYLNCKDVIVTHSVTDDGTGHLDMYFKVVDDNTILIGKYEAPFQANTGQQENAALLDETALWLAAYTKPDGTKFNVKRMIMPGHRSTNEGMVPFTYLNSTFINGRNLWPAYTFPEWVGSRNQAEAKWKEVMPDMEHIWINAETLSFWSGAIHCITRTIPKLSPGPWVGDGSCADGACAGPVNGYDGECTPHNIAQPVCWGPQWLCSCNLCDGSCGDEPVGPPPAGCGDITWEGCCDGTTLQYCEASQVKGGSCDNGCGWDGEGGYYNCGGSGADPSGAFPLSCSVCEPQCGAQECGSDGCGGSCGSCAFGQTCNAQGQCEGCVPDCVNKACGSNGCGGVCGTCGEAETCTAGQCAAVVDPCEGISWQGCCTENTLKFCEGGEISVQDCGKCGWKAGPSYYDCNGDGEDPSGTHPLACPGECVADCQFKECGSDGCGGTCGSCAANQICTGQSICETQCQPACSDKECGPDGCGGDCGTCAGGQFCSELGQCGVTCTADCTDKACGSDGCGGSCGSCGQGESCDAQGTCIAGCTPSCEGKTCGGDGCGASCGNCPLDQDCNADGQCVENCKPLCAGKICGGNGCGGTCGDCQTGEFCTPQGLCEGGCESQCEGRVCGADGCGGSCGTCAGAGICDEASGQCLAEADQCGELTSKGQCEGEIVTWCQGGEVQTFDCSSQGKTCGPKEGVGFTCIDVGSCTPSCGENTCGDDGCGGSCGACEAGAECVSGQCVDPTPTDPTDPTDPTLGTGGNSGGADSSGCQSGAPASPMPLLAWSLALLGVIGLRRLRSARN